MKIFITGGTGFVGSTLASHFLSKRHAVTVMERSLHPGRTIPEGIAIVEADGRFPGSWQEEAGRHDVIINLAGASIFTRWTATQKKLIYESRILTTKHLADALTGGKTRALLSASAVGYYGFHGDEILDETEAPGSDFLAQVCRDWEAAALQAEGKTRVVLCRFGIVMGEGGALVPMARAAKFFMGNHLGSGKQWFSWIHLLDLARVFEFLLEENISGVNCTSPYPLQNRELYRTLRETVGRPALVPPVPGFAIRLLLGEFGSVLLKGQRVVPEKLGRAGFLFSYPTMQEALVDILKG